MYITVEVHYVGYESRIMRGGNFPVNATNYEKDKMRESAIVAYQFIKQIRMEQPNAKIEKVLVNEEDITEYLINNLPKHKYLFKS